MGDKNRTLAEFQELRQHFFNPRCIHDHFIVNTCQLLNSKRNRHTWIDKGGKPVHNLSFHHLDRTDLDNPVFNRRKAGCFDIKYHIGIPQYLTLISGYDFLQIIHQIRFTSINYFKEIISVRIFVSCSLTLFFLRFPEVIQQMVCIRK